MLYEQIHMQTRWGITENEGLFLNRFFRLLCMNDLWKYTKKKMLSLVLFSKEVKSGIVIYKFFFLIKYNVFL